MNDIKLGDDVIVRVKGKVVRMELDSRGVTMQVKSDSGNYMFVSMEDLTLVNSEVHSGTANN